MIDNDVQPGRSLGPYRILNQVGQGGMATVYRAYHAAMDRYVAIKILPRQLAESPEFVGRFQQEARTIARLEHAHILPVHDYGEAEGYTYLVMRYLEAGTLKDRLQNEVLSLREVDRIFSQLADALDYAHTQGIIHRDLKPSNVLLDARGNVFLTDFGIAKLLQGSANFTSTGAMIGTPAYMSPEQAQGLPVDQRSDLYSLGIILYEMVTGRVPFEADTPLAVILKQVSAPLPLPSSVRPGLPASIEQVLLKVLSKVPEERYANVEALLAAWKDAFLAATSAATTGASAPAPTAVRPAVAPPAPPSQPGVPAATMRASSTPLPAPAPGAAPAPAGRTKLFGPLGLVGALALLLCGGGLCALFVFNQFFNSGAGTPVAGVTDEPSGEGTAPSEDATPEATLFLTAFAPGDATSEAAPDETAAPDPGDPFAGDWQSWTSSNTIFDVALYNDQLLTGGPGGVTVWDPATGEVTDHIHTGNGLPGVYVADLVVDPASGNLYIATDDGLLEYTGDEVFTHNADTGLDSYSVSAVLPTSEGLLVGTDASGVDGGGIQMRVGENEWEPVGDFPSTNDYEANPDQLTNEITVLLADEANGLLWAGTTNGLGRFDGSEWVRLSDADGLPSPYVTALALVDGTLMVGTDAGLAAYNGDQFEFVPEVEFSPVYGLVQSDDGSLWASGGGGVARRSTEGEWTVWPYLDLPGYSHYRGAAGPDGRVYFGAEYGLLTFQGDDFTQWVAPNVPVAAAFEQVTPEPNTGQLWFTEEYGVSVDIYESPKDAWFPAPQLECDACTPLGWDENVRLWASSELGLWIFHGAELMEAYTTDNGLPNNDVRSVAFGPKGTAWVATMGGLALYDNGTISVVHDTSNSDLLHDEVHRVLLAGDGSLWIGTSFGVNRIRPDGTWDAYGNGNPFSTEVRVTDLAEAPNGDIWVSTSGDGLARYRPAGDAWERYSPELAGVALNSAEINCVAVAPDGTVWAGLYFAGAARFDGEDWDTLDVDNGLIHSQVNDIYVDPNGTVWFATSGGVTKYAPQ